MRGKAAAKNVVLRASAARISEQVHSGKGKLFAPLGVDQPQVGVGVVAQGRAVARQVANFVEADVLDVGVGQEGADGAHWPVIGWLASRGGTIYHERGSNDSLTRVSQTMVERLQSGLGVGVFPEGGTGEVDKVRTFHARIFQTCYDANVPAQPVALRYVRGGHAAKAVAFRGKEAFFPNVLRLLGEPATIAEVHFLDPVPLATEGGRKRMAEAARRAIIVALGFESPPPLRAKSVDATDDLDPIAEADVPV